MKRIFRPQLPAWLLCVLVSVATAQTQKGPVKTPPRRVHIAVTVNGEDGTGISAAAITVKGPKGPYTGTTDSNGKASIEVPFILRAEYWVRADKPGYEAKDHLVVVDRSIDSKTVDAPVIVLKRRGGVFVTFKVTKEGSTLRVREAQIRVRDAINAVSDDYYRTTDSEGMALLQLPGPGTYPFFVKQDTFEPYEGKIEVKAGEQTKSVDITLKERRSEKTITVIVLGDVKNGRGGTEPIAGASVSGGGQSGVTDAKGKATLAVRPYTIEGGTEMGWAEAVDVTVSANGYKTQTKRVQLQQRRLGEESAGSETFTLERGEDAAANTAPIKVVVEVSDPIEHVALAEVTLSGLGKGQTDGKGERMFDSGKRSAEELAALRKGIKVKVTHDRHKVHESTIPPDLLKPSNEVRRYSVALEKDWTELTQGIVSLETEVATWRRQAQSVREKAQSVADLSTKCADAVRRAEAALAEVKEARKAADARKPGEACKEATDLKWALVKIRQEVQQKESTLRSALDAAIELAAKCKSPNDGDMIRTLYKTALGLTGEIGQKEKEATLKNDRLKELIIQLADNGPITNLQAGTDKIETELSLISKAVGSADTDFDRIFNVSNALGGKRAQLLPKFDELRGVQRVREYAAVLPPDLSKRLDDLEAVLGPNGTDVSMTFPPTIDKTRLNVLKETVARLQGYKNEAVALIESYKKGACDVWDQDDIVSEVGDTVLALPVELGAAGDLYAKAAACDAKAPKPSPTPSLGPREFVTVPDLSPFDTIAELRNATTKAGLSPLFLALDKPPAPGKRLFVGQYPEANTEAEKGSSLSIGISQKAAQASPSPSPVAKVTPTPSPSPVASATPTPSATPDEVVVPPIATGATMEEAKSILSAAGFNAAANAAGKAPKQDLEFKTTGSTDPPAGSKAKRGKTVTVSIYQKYEEKTSPTPTATPTPTASPSATVALGAMPDLTGKTLEQAVALLPSNMEITSDEVGIKPPSPEKELTIFAQTPAAGTKYDPKKPPVVSVKRYGSAKATEDATTKADPFTGTWNGVTPYKSGGPAEITISKDPERYAEYLILAQGHTYPFPAKSDGTTLSHDYMRTEISYTRRGEALHGVYRFKDFKDVVTTTEADLRRK